MKIPLFSIAIPTYEMGNVGASYLDFSLSILAKQTFKNFEVVISDHSANSEIRAIAVKWLNCGVDVRYHRNTCRRGSSSSNLNSAIRGCTGEYLKLLFQDDFLFSEHSLELTARCLLRTPHKHWLVSACQHFSEDKGFYREFYPHFDCSIFLGNNTISSPSVLTMKRDMCEEFDENLIWLMDVEYYKRLFNLFGYPAFLNEITVVNRVSEHQLSNRIPSAVRESELAYVSKLYK